MTTFHTDPYSDLNARGRLMRKTRDMAEADVWKLTDLLPRLFVRMVPYSLKDFANSKHRAAARRTGVGQPR